MAIFVKIYIIVSMNDDKCDDYIIIRPGEPGYEEAEKDLMNIPGNRPIPPKTFIKWMENELKALKRRQKQGETMYEYNYFGVKLDKKDVVPMEVEIARSEKELQEVKDAVEWAEKKTPGAAKNGNLSLILMDYRKEMGLSEK